MDREVVEDPPLTLRNGQEGTVFKRDHKKHR